MIFRKNHDIYSARGKGSRSLHRRALFPAAAALLLFLLAGCEWINGPDLTPPLNLAATTGLSDIITLTWDPVEKADIYYIYRSGSEDGEFTYAGFVPLPEEDDNSDDETAGEEAQLTWSDSDIAYQVNYWYSVTAAHLVSNNESVMTDAVMGRAEHDYAWSTAATAGTGAAAMDLALDTADGSETGTPFMITVDDDATGAVSVYEYDGGSGTWSAVGDSLGTSDSSAVRPAAVAAYDGTIHAAYTDAGLSNRVTVKTWNSADETWDVVGTAGFSGDNADYLSMDTDSATGTVYLGYIDGTGAVEIRNNGNDFVSAADPTTGTILSSLTIAQTGSTTHYAVEIDTPAVETSLANQSVSVDLNDNYLDIAAVSATEIYVAYHDDSGFFVRKYNGSWNDITPTTPAISPDPSTASVALAWDSEESTLYLLYHDTLQSKVLKYSGSGSDWEETADTDTENGIAVSASNLELEAFKNFLYAGYISIGAGSASLRVWE